MNRIELGRKLRSAREICGISQQEAAAAIAAPRTAITQIEAGKRSVSTLELSKLARRYRVPVARFFEDDGLPEDGNLVLALPRVVTLLAHHFGVSYQAAVYRLKSLRHISSSQTEQLLANEMHGKNYLQALNLLDDLEKPEVKTHWDCELRSEIAHLAIEAFRQEEISRGRVLEISKSLGIDGERLLVLAEAARD